MVLGEFNHGKTTFLIGVAGGFLSCDHMVLWIDAERTTPFDWLENMLGSELSHHPGFLARRPETYEKTIAEVRQFCLGIAQAKEANKLPEETCGLIVIDSIRKLVPASIMKQIEEENSKGKDADPSRRSAQIKAAMNANWLDELVPILERGSIGMAVVARETEDPDASPFSKKFGTNYKVGGGKALYYDASLAIRVERAAWVTKAAAAEGTAPVVYGERHRATIHKTKVAGKEDKSVKTYFHTSNGVFIPAGFDRVRDILDLGQRFGVITKSGSWLCYGKDKIANSEHNSVKVLTEDKQLFGIIEAAVREQFAHVKPLEEDGA